MLSRGLYHRCNLKRDFQITDATIIQVGTNMGRNGSWDVTFTFVTQTGQVIERTQYFMIDYSKRKYLVGKTVPCTYDPRHPVHSELLIYERTWKQHDLSFPDSMKWTKEYFNDVFFSY